MPKAGTILHLMLLSPERFSSPYRNIPRGVGVPWGRWSERFYLSLTSLIVFFQPSHIRYYGRHCPMGVGDLWAFVETLIVNSNAILRRKSRLLIPILLFRDLPNAQVIAGIAAYHRKFFNGCVNGLIYHQKLYSAAYYHEIWQISS